MNTAVGLDKPPASDSGERAFSPGARGPGAILLRVGAANRRV